MAWAFWGLPWFFLSAIIYVHNSKGTLEIETADPNVQVAVKQNGEVVEVVDAKSGWKISLKSGEYELAMQGSTDQVQLDKNSVVVKRGDTIKVKVTLKPPVVSDSKSEISYLKSPLPAIGSLIGPNGKWKLPPGASPPAIAPFDEKKAKEHQKAWSKYLGVPVEITNSIGMKFVLIPPGEFMMGSRGSDGYAGDRRENPQHRVRITKPFYFGVYAVTQEDYERVMGVNPSYFSATGQGNDQVAGQDTKRFPVENVSWEDAENFCCQMSEIKEENAASRLYRLPSEAQWQYACRAGTTARWYFGARSDENNAAESQLSDYAWFAGNSGGRTHAVGEKKPNAWDLYDIHGNVLEWCADWYDMDYYKVSPLIDPTGPLSGSRRVLLGGCWNQDACGCRDANRGHYEPWYRNGGTGFRVALVVPDTVGERAKMIGALETGRPSGSLTVDKPSPPSASTSFVRLPAIGSLIGPDGKWKLPPGAPPPAIAPFDEKKAKEHQAAWAKYLGVPVEITNSIGMKFVLIPPGEFEMGSPKELIEEELKAHGDDGWYEDHLPGEGPQHRVRITKPFCLGAYGRDAGGIPAGHGC